MSKKSFGTIIEKPTGTLHVKYIDRYDILPNGKRKAHYATKSTHSTSRRVAQAMLDELEETFGTKKELQYIENLKRKVTKDYLMKADFISPQMKDQMIREIDDFDKEVERKKKETKEKKTKKAAK